MEVKIDSYITEKSDLNNLSIEINRAIEDASKFAFSKVVFSKNKTYRAGTIYLKSNVELVLEEGSLLLASDNIQDFSKNGNVQDKKLDKPTWEDCSYNGNPTLFFIYGKDLKNIKISGPGHIDGNEKIFYGKISNYHIDGYFYPRVPLLYLENIENLIIENITFQHSAFWTTHLVGCRDVIINRLIIDNNLILANCDGIDPDHCQNVRITNCKISCADDCIVFKTTSGNKKYGTTRNIYVDSCILESTSAAIKFGSESTQDFHDIKISNCKIVNSNRGISFQLRDEGNISNVYFENMDIKTHLFSPIEWWGKGEPIYISAVKRDENTSLGFISNIHFKNINAHSESPLFIYSQDNNISRIIFEDCNFDIKEITKWEHNIHDLRPSSYYSQPFSSPFYQAYIQKSKDVKLLNCNFNSAIKSDKEPIYSLNSEIEAKNTKFN